MMWWATSEKRSVRKLYTETLVRRSDWPIAKCAIAITARRASVPITTTRNVPRRERDTPGWSSDRIAQVKQSGEQIDVPVKQIPVYFSYISAWGTPDGVVQFRPDIYNLDGGSATASAY